MPKDKSSLEPGILSLSSPAPAGETGRKGSRGREGLTLPYQRQSLAQAELGTGSEASRER